MDAITNQNNNPSVRAWEEGSKKAVTGGFIKGFNMSKLHKVHQFLGVWF